MRVWIVVSLFRIISSENQEMKLIIELNNYFNFDHNVFS